MKSWLHKFCVWPECWLIEHTLSISEKTVVFEKTARKISLFTSNNLACFALTQKILDILENRDIRFFTIL